MKEIKNPRELDDLLYILYTGDYTGEYDFYYFSPTLKIRMYFKVIGKKKFRIKENDKN